MIDAELSQIAFLLDLMQVIDVDVVHNQVELTKNKKDPLKPKVRFEGDPTNPIDFHYPQNTFFRVGRCNAIAKYMQTLGLDTSWWEGVKSGENYAWQKLAELDINRQMNQFVIKMDAQGQVLSVEQDQRSEDARNALVKQ
jgi:hypothetical protein